MAHNTIILAVLVGHLTEPDDGDTYLRLEMIVDGERYRDHDETLSVRLRRVLKDHGVHATKDAIASALGDVAGTMRIGVDA